MATQPVNYSALQRYAGPQLDENGQPLSPWGSYAQPGGAVTDPATGGNPYGTPNNPNLNNPSPSNPVYGNVGAPPGGQSGQYATTSPGTNLPTLNTDPNQPIHNMFYNDQALETGMGQQIYNEAQNQLGYYGPLQQQYQGAQDTALSDLQKTPGYTDAETAAIKGDPNAVRDVTTSGIGNEQSALDQYGGKLDTAVGKYGQGVGTGMAKLDTAVNNPALAFDPNATEKQLSDADVQEMKTAAGTRVGNQYRSAEDTLMRQAAAAGNTSPMAVAAARARLEAQSAAGQGDAETSADIAARQAQQDRAAQIEAQREGAVQTQTGFKAGAANSDIAAQEAVGQTGVNAANQFGQTNIAQQTTQTQQGATAAKTADDTTSARAADVAGARIAGQGAYRQGVAQQQGMAQQGGQSAIGAQQGAANQVTQGLNQSTASRANYENTGPGGLGKAGSQIFGSLISGGATAAAGAGYAKGGVITEPTIGVVGEKGPEMIVPMPRYRPRKAA